MYNAPPSVIAASKRSKIREAFLNLLIREKKEGLVVKCGLRAMDQVVYMSECIISDKTYFVSIAGCWIKIEKDFDLDPNVIMFNEEVIFS